MVYLSPFIPGRMGAGLDILWSHSHPLLFEPNQTVHLGLKILKSSTSAHGVSTLVNCPSSVWDWKLEGLGLANQAPLEKPRVLHAMHCSDRRPIWVMHTCQREKCWSFFFLGLTLISLVWNELRLSHCLIGLPWGPYLILNRCTLPMPCQAHSECLGSYLMGVGMILAPATSGSLAGLPSGIRHLQSNNSDFFGGCSLYEISFTFLQLIRTS